MNILHIACTNGDMCNGVQVVVPQHLKAQSEHATVAIVNISNIKFNEKSVQFEYKHDFSIEKLPTPFNKPDIVVFHECYRIQYIKIAKELHKLRIPYVIIPHGELSKDAQKKKRYKKIVANILIFNRFIYRASGVQLLSSAELRNTKFRVRKFVATNGICIPKVRKQKFSEKGIKFVYIGRLDAYHKGLDLMIEGVSKCAEFLRSTSCTVDIYGPNILGRREHIEKLIAKYNISDLFVLHESVLGEEKENILLGGDVFLQTSRFEGMPMGILEAMSYGVPCLVTEGTTLAEFVEKNNAGWSCATDATEIAQKIKQAIVQKDMLVEKSNNARDAVRRNFAWDSISSQTIETYRNLVGKTR